MLLFRMLLGVLFVCISANAYAQTADELLAPFLSQESDESERMGLPTIDPERPVASLMALSCHLSMFDQDKGFLLRDHALSEEEARTFEEELVVRHRTALVRAQDYLSAEDWEKLGQETQAMLVQIHTDTRNGKIPTGPAMLHACMTRGLTLAEAYDPSTPEQPESP